MATGQITDTQQAPLVVQKLDKKGKPTGDDFDAPPSWDTSDHAVATVVVAPDGSATLVAGDPGTCQVNFSAANNGVPFAGTVDVTVVAGDVAQVSISIGTPIEQP